MSDLQNLPGTGINGEHRVYSNFYSDNNIIQQVAIVQPKNLLIDAIRSVFRNDNIYTFRTDEYGYPLTPDLTGKDIGKAVKYVTSFFDNKKTWVA